MGRSLKLRDRSATLAIVSLFLLSSAALPIACGDDTTGDSGTSDNTGASGATGGTGNAGGGTAGSTTSGGAGPGGDGGVGAAGGMGGGTAGMGGMGGGTAGMGGIGGGVGGSGGNPNIPDPDMDGWTDLEGDCCENDNDCSDPAKVNPGAFEYLGNGIDDDCNPATQDGVAPAPCSTQALATPTSSLELVQAMDLCDVALLNPPMKKDLKWGVISSELVAADGTPVAPDNVQVGVLSAFGPNVAPKKATTMAAISSGTGRAEGDPSYVHPQNGPGPMQTGNYNAGNQCGVPPAWLAANGGTLPVPQNCPACVGPTCTTAFDSVNLRVQIRVPTNAESFSYNFKFYSAEFPEYLCEEFNDFFITLLQTQVPISPQSCMCGDNLCQKTKCMETKVGCMADCADDKEDATLPFGFDGNIAFDSLGNPVSVNNGFFDVCFAQMAGQCPAGTVELVGNGMGGWNGALSDGGGTVWLFNDAPAKPGEIITLEFVTWDAGDHNVDSLVLLDNFKWKVNPSQVGVHE